MIADHSPRTYTVRADPSVYRWTDGRGLSNAADGAVARLVLSGHHAGDTLTFCEVCCTVDAAALPELLTFGVLTVVENPDRCQMSDDCAVLRVEPCPADPTPVR